MDIAAADLCHGNNLPSMCFVSPWFQRFIRLLRSGTVGPDWEPPNRNRIGGELLNMNYLITFNNNVNSCLREAKIFGLAMLGDFATIRRMPLLNVVGSPANSPPIVLEVKDSTPQLQLGRKKDARYVFECFLNHLKVLDPTKTLVDFAYFLTVRPICR